MQPFTTTLRGLAALSALAALPAWACTVQSTPQGPRITDCNLSAFSEGRFDVDLSNRPPDPRRRVLPNLVPQALSFFVSGTLVDVELTVRNTAGIANAAGFEMGTVWWTVDPLTGRSKLAPHQAYHPVQVPSLPRSTSRRYPVRQLMLPNRNQDWDLCVSAVVDPMPSGGPAQGRVPESNEDDNLLEQCCRVYGPNPDTSGPPPCV